MHVAQVVLAAAVLAAAPVALSAPCSGFTDVDDSSPFCANVAWMKSRNITLGCTSTTLYCPDNLVTRLQMAAFMYRLGFQNAFLRGGNAFGAPAVLGTTDNQPIEVNVGGVRAARYDQVSGMINVIAGGPGNVALTGASGVAIAGGSENTAGDGATISGGRGNTAGAAYATIGGGTSNHASGIFSTVPGGNNNRASGFSAFAAGRYANAQLGGCFVWADSSALSSTSCFASNEFIARALGGFYFFTAGNSDANYSGARLASGTGAWAAYSDRDGKHEVRRVDVRAVLEGVVQLPIATWQWKAEAGDTRHMGPMAQDFHASFGLGARDTEIVTVDADGVALAAIQGLNAKLEDRLAAKEAEIAVLRAEIAAIRAMLVPTQQASR
jgi:hypothetical protein